MDAAIRYNLIAGDDAMRLFAIGDAITIYEQVLHEHSDEDDWLAKIPSSERRHLYVQLGRAYELNDELEKACSIYSEMLTYAKVCREPEMECAALNRLATVIAHDSVNVAKAVALLHQTFRMYSPRFLGLFYVTRRYVR